MFMKVCLFLHILGVYWEVGGGGVGRIIPGLMKRLSYCNIKARNIKIDVEYMFM